MIGGDQSLAQVARIIAVNLVIAQVGHSLYCMFKV